VSAPEGPSAGRYAASGRQKRSCLSACGVASSGGTGVDSTMNRPLVDRLADAVLYEGYILYPYRPSVKNRQRWTFGGIYPEAFVKSQGNGDACFMQTECLVRGSTKTALKVRVRFLHLLSRQVHAVAREDAGSSLATDHSSLTTSLV